MKQLTVQLGLIMLAVYIVLSLIMGSTGSLKAEGQGIVTQASEEIDKLD